MRTCIIRHLIDRPKKAQLGSIDPALRRRPHRLLCAPQRLLALLRIASTTPPASRNMKPVANTSLLTRSGARAKISPNSKNSSARGPQITGPRFQFPWRPGVIAVTFEVILHSDRKSDYLDMATLMHLGVYEVDGLISVGRFQRPANPCQLLPHSFFRNGEAMADGRRLTKHRAAQRHVHRQPPAHDIGNAQLWPV